MNITVHNIYLTEPGATYRKASAVVNFDDMFAVHGVAVVEGRDGSLRIRMPNKKLKNGTYVDIAHPINKDCRQQISDIVLEAYEKALREKAEA